MTREEILGEGYLAAYITGELSQEDNQEVEQYLRTDEEIRRESFNLQKTLELLSFRHSLAPSSVVKRWVMEDPEVMNSNLGGEGFGRGLKLAMAASIVIAVMSLLSAFYFWNQWQDTDYRLAEITAHNIELAESFRTVNQELTDIRQDIAVLVSPEFSRIILNGTDNAQNAKAVIYWNPAEKEIYLNSANLSQLPKTQQYQLWALVDGVPVDAGVFNAQEGKFQIMKDIADADAFAVTVEKSGGVENPTLSTMQVYGEAI